MESDVQVRFSLEVAAVVTLTAQGHQVVHAITTTPAQGYDVVDAYAPIPLAAIQAKESIALFGLLLVDLA